MRIIEWSKKFQELLFQIPAEYWLFAADGNLYLMKLDKNGKRIVDQNGSMSQSAIVRVFRSPNDIDGGAW